MKRLLLAFLLFTSSVFAATPEITEPQASTFTLLSAVITTGAGSGVQPRTPARTFQAHGTTSAGSGAATILIQVSNVASPGTNDWITGCTLSLTLGVTSTTDGCAMNAYWRHVRANVSALSGTDGTVTVLMGAPQ